VLSEEQESEEEQIAEAGPGASIEDIVEQVQGIELPQRSLREEQLALATEHYMKVIKNPEASSEERLTAERKFREASEGFSTQPGLEALLKLEALSAQYQVPG
jgi:hypothetical protein